MEARLLVISPVRNEAPHIGRVVRAVAMQTRPPDAWLVIDDGSTDGTLEQLRDLALEVPFMTVRSSADSSPRPRDPDRLASALDAKAFNAGLGSVPWQTFTHIAKLDGDIELPAHYFDSLLARFSQAPALGLAGGCLVEPSGSGWKRLTLPERYHVHGALKTYSLDCFRAVGGVQERLGWDTIDEVYARMRDFETRSFPDLVAVHHRPAASADGILRGRARHGRCAYIVHQSLPWVLVRSLKQACRRPIGLSGAAFLYGYLAAATGSTARVDDRSFRRFARRELRSRAAGAATGRVAQPRRMVRETLRR